MKDLSRRDFFILAGVTAAGVALSGVGLTDLLAHAPVVGAADVTGKATAGSRAKVYFTKYIDAAHLIQLYDKINEGIYGKIAVKLHTGEKHGPNILPRDESVRRLYWQRELIRQLPTPEPVDLLACDYDGQRYIDAVRGLEREPEGGARCTVCFRLRLEETARQARAHGFDFFGTTLTVSPH